MTHAIRGKIVHRGEKAVRGKKISRGKKVTRGALAKRRHKCHAGIDALIEEELAGELLSGEELPDPAAGGYMELVYEPAAKSS